MKMNLGGKTMSKKKPEIKRVRREVSEKRSGVTKKDTETLEYLKKKRKEKGD